MAIHLKEIFKMSDAKTIHDLFVEELQDIYHAEKQLTKALKKMAKAASNQELADGFLAHLEETEGQIERLEEVFENLGMRAKAKPCEAMKGLIEEATEMMGEDLAPEVMDVALVSCAQKVEHYEIASYGTLVTLAEAMGHDAIAALLQETLDEEKACDEHLTEIAESDINPTAMEHYESESESEQNEEGIFGNFGGKKRERYAEMQRSATSGTARRGPGRPAGSKSTGRSTGKKSPGRPKKAGSRSTTTRKKSTRTAASAAKKPAKKTAGRRRA